MSICPKCEREIKDGEHVRVEVLAVYRKETDMMHGISAYAEEWLEHLHCPYESN